MKNIVAIVGKPNVGKSTFFNRLVQKKMAIELDMPGVTRDRLYETVNFRNRSFKLIDTGGITTLNHDFSDEIKIQAQIAIQEANIIIFLMDAKSGLTTDDREILKILVKANKTIIPVVNKVDNLDMQNNAYEFYELGLKNNIIYISASHGSQVDDVLEAIYDNLSDEQSDEFDGISFAIIGKPNVGKSTFFNAITGSERVIVSDIEGTTRDSIDFHFTKDEQNYKIIDTAGIRKRGKIWEKVEKYSVLRTLKAIDEANIVLWMIDGSQEITEQDKRVLGFAFEEKKPIIVIVNKWDKVQVDQSSQDIYSKKLKANMPFIQNSPIIFVSALNKKGLNKVMPVINELHNKNTKEFKTSLLNEILLMATSSRNNPSFKGKEVNFSYITQVGKAPITFLIFVNNKELVHFSYMRYLENIFIRNLQLEGVKINLIFRNKSHKKN